MQRPQPTLLLRTSPPPQSIAFHAHHPSASRVCPLPVPNSRDTYHSTRVRVSYKALANSHNTLHSYSEYSHLTRRHGRRPAGQLTISITGLSCAGSPRAAFWKSTITLPSVPCGCVPSVAKIGYSSEVTAGARRLRPASASWLVPSDTGSSRLPTCVICWWLFQRASRIGTLSCPMSGLRRIRSTSCITGGMKPRPRHDQDGVGVPAGARWPSTRARPRDRWIRDGPSIARVNGPSSKGGGRGPTTAVTVRLACAARSWIHHRARSLASRSSMR